MISWHDVLCHCRICLRGEETNDEEHEITQDTEELELKVFAAEHCLVDSDEGSNPELFPELSTMPPGLFYRFLSIPDEAVTDLEYVYMRRLDEYGLTGDDY